jgi:uncharacterized repeat protein (TIGR01451 family)
LGLASLLLMYSTASAALQSFTTPATTGTYTIPPGVTRVQLTARGADGGQATGIATYGSGAGAFITSIFNVSPGDTIRYVVGQRGSNGDLESGGGGGTGVFINSTLVLVAGGGGGEDNTGNGGGGQAGTTGGAGTTGTTNGAAGTAGAGGAGGNNGGLTAPVGDGGGGGGGINSAGGNVASVGASLTTGGAQADTNLADGLSVSSGGTSNQTTDPSGADGLGASGGAGFGGGGAASHRESGGGGGYSGGGGGGSGGSPGGGGSYLNTAYAGYVSGTITAGANSSAGGIDGNFTVAYTTLQLRKISTGNIGSFSFSSPNMSTSPVVVTTTATSTAASSAVIPLTNFGTSTTITEAAVTGYTTTAITCSGFGTSGTTTPNLPARTITLDASATAAGNDLICTYTNNWPGPALTIQKTANTAGPVSVGQVITYTYTVSNPSPITINNISISDVHNGLGLAPVPGSEILLTDAAPAGNSTDSTANNGTWSVLATGDSIRFTSTYTVTQGDIDFRQ